MMDYLLFPEQKLDYQLVGGKAGTLSALVQARLPIPEWFVLTPEAFNQSLTEQQQQSFMTLDNEEAFRELIESVEIPQAMQDEIFAAYDSITQDSPYVAVRSSAVDEDGSQHSFAGQLESYLYITREELLDHIKLVWLSGFSERVLLYRSEAGLKSQLQAPAVIIQAMVEADSAGVAFEIDPVSGNRQISVIAAVYGLGSALVNGDVDADTFHVDRTGQVIKRALADKTVQHCFDKGNNSGVITKTVPADKQSKPAIEYIQVKQVADLVHQASNFFKQPQDIEWAIRDNRLYLLQSRPITNVTQLADPEGELNIWDNSNIAESYGGVTTPLTFSFARKAYEEVYREFCRILKVSDEVIRENDQTYKRMLGLIRGRVYYNMISWYRVLAMLPGFKMNQKFMEQMMGVKEGMPEEVLETLEETSALGKLHDTGRFIYSLFGLLGNHFLLPFKIKRFYKRLNHALELPNEELNRMRADELARYYHTLEQQLLTRWDAPLINDFFAMIFYGVLGKLTKKWCQDEEATLQNNLLCGEGGMISAEPARRVSQMARLAKEHPKFITSLKTSSLEAIEKNMASVEGFKNAYVSYLYKFGDRCLDELKLESETLHDNPILLLRSIGALAERYSSESYQDPVGVEQKIRDDAEQHVQQSIGKNFFKRIVFNWVLKHARNRVRDRENLRFERTRLFGRVRRIFVEIGKRFEDAALIRDARDIFYLEVNEVMGLIEGTTSTAKVKELIELRYKEFEDFKTGEAPADRFETRGIVYQGNSFKASRSAAASVDMQGDSLKGIGCCPGVVRGPVRVIHDPKHACLQAGDILVAERTDPGWIMLFPSASGLLVERGSLLSHSAIVAREMGIPAIVSVPGITTWLRDGDYVEFDGSTGVIRKIDTTEEEEFEQEQEAELSNETG
jgi:pyruvate,water dikinase